MGIVNTIGWRTPWLKRVVAYCCRELEYPADRLCKASFNKASRDPYRGKAYLEWRTIRVKINSANRYPQEDHAQGGLPKIDLADAIEVFVLVTAHEIAHLERWERFARERKRQGKRDTLCERDTESLARGVLESFRRDREALLARWGESGLGPAPPEYVYRLRCETCGREWIRNRPSNPGTKGERICTTCHLEYKGTRAPDMPEPPALSCERIPFAPTAPDNMPIDTKEEHLEIVSEQTETEVAGVAMAAKRLGMLSRFERDELDRCEEIVSRGLASFVTVGSALAQIRDLRLYREEFGTFEDYCRERWDPSRAHAYRLVDAAGVAVNLSPIGDMPTSESQVRLLARLEPDQQREAWSRAVETAPGGRVTAAHVAGVVAAYRDDEPDDPAVEGRRPARLEGGAALSAWKATLDGHCRIVESIRDAGTSRALIRGMSMEEREEFVEHVSRLVEEMRVTRDTLRRLVNAAGSKPAGAVGHP